MKRIYSWEPWFFVFFGLFHMHRIWALIDRETYAFFWMRIMENKGLQSFLIMGILDGLCIVGIITFFRECKANYATEIYHPYTIGIKVDLINYNK
ncbi:MAG: hypothetical protein K6G76_05790 [Lachnospiraceae bacterium]|nr:hypothetical protein [Lachnospiraceae bacterium]